MWSQLDLLMERAQEGLTRCGACHLRQACLFATPHQDPGQCLHEYKLLHAFAARRLRTLRPTDSASYARLMEEFDRYSDFLRKERPFDPGCLSNVAPQGPGVPTSSPEVQSNLVAFGVH